jgi:hypothetical protein
MAAKDSGVTSSPTVKAPTTKGTKPKPKAAEAGRTRVADRDTEGPAMAARFDLGPWAETPSSSRVSRYRYDYSNRAVQVQWRNNYNHGYIYQDVPYEDYRSFARVVSKGRYVNSTLNGYPYRVMTVDEVSAPSNEHRNLVSRARD